MLSLKVTQCLIVFLLSSDHNWQMITPEDVIVRHKIKVQIINQIEQVVKSILDDEQKDKTSPPPSIPRNCVPDFLFPLKTFHLLQEKNILPEIVQGKRVKYELDSNRLIVQVMPSPAHDAAANAWNHKVVLWSRNGGAGPKTLMHCGQGRTCSV